MSVLLYDILDDGENALYLIESFLVTVEGGELVRKDLDKMGLRESPKPLRSAEMTKYERGILGGNAVEIRRREIKILILLCLCFC